MDRWRAVKDSSVSNYFDYRFDREFGYEKHIVAASKGLMKKLGGKIEDFTYAVFQQPDDRLPALVARALGIGRELLAPGIASTLGDLGSCSAFVSLASILDKAKPGERILLASYGSGSSTAASMVVSNQIEEKKKNLGAPLEKFLERKEYIDYTTYLKVTEAIKRAPY